jgi:hypothetical protein
MNKITKLRVAIDILSTDAQFTSVSFIGELGWRVIPEAYKFENTIVLAMYRVNIYSLGDTKIVDIEGLGMFQII